MDVQLAPERIHRPCEPHLPRHYVYQSAFENAIEGIFQLSPDGRYLGANPALARIFGYSSPEELQGRLSAPGANIYVQPGRRAEFQRLMLQNGMVSGFESEVYRKDGSTIWISENAVPVRDETGRVMSYEGFVIDITERRVAKAELARTRGDLEASLRELKAVQAQALESERLRALGAMVNGIAHDFNNSLWMILGYSELLQQLCRKKVVASEFTEYVDTIVRASLEAVDAITRLTDFQREDELSKEQVPLKLNEILDKAIKFTRPRWETEASGRGTPIEIERNFGAIEPVTGSASEFCEVFTQIILNAVDAMPQGGVITIETRMHAGKVVIAIADTGIGMTPEVQRRCLDPFFSTKGGRNAGVGLTVVKDTLERHDGTVHIDSAPGRGARFSFSFPPAHRADLHAATARPRFDRSLHILAVDDHPVQTELLARALVADRHTVRTAANGRDAIECFDSETFDLVITDKAMPGMSGDQLAAAIKAREPGTPVIMLTGLGRSEDDEGLSEFVDMLVPKPASLEDLRSAITSVMN